MSDIFISYKREDQPAARRLADALEQEGWSVWWDPKLRAGEHFDDVIEAALKKSKCVVVLWSAGSSQSSYVRDEATYALEQKKLVPVAIETVDLPFRFRRVHTLKLLNWDGSSDSSEYRKLVKDISVLLVQPANLTPIDQRASEGKQLSDEGPYREQSNRLIVGNERPSRSEEPANRTPSQEIQRKEGQVARSWSAARQAERVGRTSISKTWLIWGLSGSSVVLIIIGLIIWWPKSPNPETNLSPANLPRGMVAVYLRAEPETARAGDPLTFIAELKPPADGVEYKFRFGDGSESGWTRIPRESHSYSVSGAYTVIVMARIPGATLTQSPVVRINIGSSSPW